MSVIVFARLCDACRDSLHTRCWERLGEPAPCPCGCWDDQGALTEAALLDMMAWQPDVLARYIRGAAGFARSAFDWHLMAAQQRQSDRWQAGNSSPAVRGRASAARSPR